MERVRCLYPPNLFCYHGTHLLLVWWWWGGINFAATGDYGIISDVNQVRHRLRSPVTIVIYIMTLPLTLTQRNTPGWIRPVTVSCQKMSLIRVFPKVSAISGSFCNTSHSLRSSVSRNVTQRTTFRDNPSVPFSRVKQSKMMSQNDSN